MLQFSNYSIHLFLGGSTEYGLNPGWQREIGIWNLGLIAILIGTLVKGSPDTVKIVAGGAVVIGLGFGTNHLVGYIQDHTMYMNLFGALENYLFAALIILGVKRNYARK